MSNSIYGSLALDSLDTSYQGASTMPDFPDDKNTFNLTEAAAYLGLHAETVRRMIKDKRIAADLIIVGGRAQWQMRRADLDKVTVNPPHRPSKTN